MANTFKTAKASEFSGIKNIEVYRVNNYGYHRKNFQPYNRTILVSELMVIGASNIFIHDTNLLMHYVN